MPTYLVLASIVVVLDRSPLLLASSIGIHVFSTCLLCPPPLALPLLLPCLLASLIHSDYVDNCASAGTIIRYVIVSLISAVSVY